MGHDASDWFYISVEHVGDQFVVYSRAFGGGSEWRDEAGDLHVSTAPLNEVYCQDERELLDALIRGSVADDGGKATLIYLIDSVDQIGQLHRMVHERMGPRADAVPLVGRH